MKNLTVPTFEMDPTETNSDSLAPVLKQQAVLVVDDDPLIGATLRRILTKGGYQVVEVRDAERALEILKGETFDAVFTDLDMPGMSGVELLRRVKVSHPWMKGVLLTGNPSVDTAMAAANAGVLAYLTKPFTHEQVLEVASWVSSDAVVPSSLRSFRMSRSQRRAHFEEGLRGLFVHYQPIICWSSRSVRAYEALMRTRSEAIPHPGAFLDLAEALGCVHELGRAVRGAVAEELGRAARIPHQIFVNLHPQDLLDDDLYDSSSPLSRFATMIVLELTEREDLRGIPDVHERVEALRGLGYRIAIDDIGAGYSGLSSFIELDPHLIKLDMGLVRGIDQCRKRQRLVAALVKVAHEMEIEVVAEGVETRAERDALLALDCDLQQGFLFSRPEAPFARPRLT